MFRQCVFAVVAAMSILVAPHSRSQVATTGPYWAGPAVSGSWYDPARDGEGIVLQYLPNGKALLT